MLGSKCRKTKSPLANLNSDSGVFQEVSHHAHTATQALMLVTNDGPARSMGAIFLNFRNRFSLREN